MNPFLRYLADKHSAHRQTHADDHKTLRPTGSGKHVSVRFYSDFIGAKDDGGGGNNWSYKTRKAPGKSSPTNPHSAFFRPDAVVQQSQSTEGKTKLQFKKKT